MKLLQTLIGMLAVTLFTTAAVADDPSGHEGSKTAAKFDKLDRNDDGNVSKSEAKDDSKLSAQFASVDQDSDGNVSESEYTAMAQSDQSMRSDRERSDYSRQPTPQPGE